MSNPRYQSVNLVAQAQCTAAAIVAALVLRRFDRFPLPCDAAALSGAIEPALCRVKTLVYSSLSLNVGLTLIGLALAAALVARLLLRVLRKAPVYIVDFSVHNPDPR